MSNVHPSSDNSVDNDVFEANNFKQTDEVINEKPKNDNETFEEDSPNVNFHSTFDQFNQDINKALLINSEILSEIYNSNVGTMNNSLNVKTYANYLDLCKNNFEENSKLFYKYYNDLLNLIGNLKKN